MINKIIAPMATKWAPVYILKGTKCYDSSYGGQITSESAYYNFTENGKVTAEDYTVIISNIGMTDVMHNTYAETNEGYVKVYGPLTWYNSKEEAEKAERPTGLLSPEYLSIKNQIKDFLILPLWSPNNPSKGETCYAEELNWWFTKYKVRTEESNQEYTTHITYIPTRFTSIIAAIAIAIIGIIWYKSKH